jgi:hypothetical protein
LDPWHDPRGDLAQVLEIARREMERAQALTREFQWLIDRYEQPKGERSREPIVAARNASSG